MVSLAAARKIALSLDEAEERPHFEKPSFSIRKKIFLTLDEKHKRACIRLGEIDQDIYCNINPEMIYPVPNKWGKQGWTFIDLSLISSNLFKEALLTSYCTVAPKALALKYSTS